MVDSELLKTLEYSDFAPVFFDIERCFKRLDALDIRMVVGDRVVDLMEDRFIRLVMATFEQLTPTE